jgi:hypothetical protein
LPCSGVFSCAEGIQILSGAMTARTRYDQDRTVAEAGAVGEDKKGA